jgi:hypothetical protein
MNKIIFCNLTITALLISQYMPQTKPKGANEENWTTATLHKGEGWKPCCEDWRNPTVFKPGQQKLIKEVGQKLDNITLKYKNEENKVTIALTGLNAIPSSRNLGGTHIISTKDSMIDVSLESSFPDKTYILVSRSIFVPEEKYAEKGVYPPLNGENFSQKLEKRDNIKIPILKKIDPTLLISSSPDERRLVYWGVLSVSADIKGDTYVITFAINPGVGVQQYDPNWLAWS